MGVSSTGMLGAEIIHQSSSPMKGQGNVQGRQDVAQGKVSTRKNGPPCRLLPIEPRSKARQSGATAQPTRDGEACGNDACRGPTRVMRCYRRSHLPEGPATASGREDARPRAIGTHPDGSDGARHVRRAARRFSEEDREICTRRSGVHSRTTQALGRSDAERKLACGAEDNEEDGALAGVGEGSADGEAQAEGFRPVPQRHEAVAEVGDGRAKERPSTGPPQRDDAVCRARAAGERMADDGGAYAWTDDG